MNISIPAGKIFSITSFMFISFLLSITVYEVFVTKYLANEVDTIKKWDAMHTKYSDFGIHNFIDEGPLYHPSIAKFIIPHLYFSIAVGLDEDEEFESEKEKNEKGFYDDKD
jgi:hypothetical protein